MAKHCFQCHTQLYVPPQERSPEVKAAVKSMDRRMYGGIGAIALFLVGAGLFGATGAVCLGVVGGVLGRFVACKKSSNE